MQFNTNGWDATFYQRTLNAAVILFSRSFIPLIGISAHQGCPFTSVCSMLHRRRFVTWSWMLYTYWVMVSQIQAHSMYWRRWQRWMNIDGWRSTPCHSTAMTSVLTSSSRYQLIQRATNTYPAHAADYQHVPSSCSKLLARTQFMQQTTSTSNIWQKLPTVTWHVWPPVILNYCFAPGCTPSFYLLFLVYTVAILLLIR